MRGGSVCLVEDVYGLRMGINWVWLGMVMVDYG